MSKKKSKKSNGRHPVKYESYYVLANGRDPALLEAASYFHSQGMKATEVTKRGGPSASTVRRYVWTDGKFTKRPNATTFFAFLATLDGVRGYDVKKKKIIME